MKQILVLAIGLMLFQVAAVAQINTFSLANYSSTTLTSPNDFLSTAQLLRENSSKGFFNIYVGGIGVRNKTKDWGYGGQVDVLLNLGSKVSLGGLGNIQKIGSDQFTPVIAYARLNLHKSIGIQGGYGWYMNDFDYNFANANNGYYGGVVLGGEKINLEIGGYFPDNEDYRLTIGLKTRLFKL